MSNRVLHLTLLAAGLSVAVGPAWAHKLKAFATAAGATQVAVKSHHHQGIDRVGEGLRVTGWALDDNTTEAIELPEARYALGVLWHPEEDGQSHVIASLVESARGVRA